MSKIDAVRLATASLRTHLVDLRVPVEQRAGLVRTHPVESVGWMGNKSEPVLVVCVARRDLLGIPATWEGFPVVVRVRGRRGVSKPALPVA